MDAKTKAVAERIESLKQAIRIATEYLESGKHADWHKFQPWCVRKLKDGKQVPPHRDWVRSMFLPRIEKALARTEKVLERLDEQARERRK